MSTWFNLASARDIIYIYIRVRVCVRVCVCACACVCMWQFLRNQNDKYVFPDDPIKHATRWVWVVLRTELGGFCLNKKSPLSEKDIGRVTHSENTYGRTTHGKYMFKTNYSLNQIVFPTIFRPQNCCEPTVLENENSQCCWSCNSCTFMLTIINLKCLD